MSGKNKSNNDSDTNTTQLINLMREQLEEQKRQYQEEKKLQKELLEKQEERMQQEQEEKKLQRELFEKQEERMRREQDLLRQQYEDRLREERNERKKEQDERKKEQERQEERWSQHTEFMVKMMEKVSGPTFSNNSNQSSTTNLNQTPKPPKVPLPHLKDDMDPEIFFKTFERIAKQQNWEKSTWGTQIAALIIESTKGAQAYQSLSDDSADNYDKIKEAILKNFKISSEVRKRQFKQIKKDPNETYTMFMERIKSACKAWQESEPHSSLEDLIIREKFYENITNELHMFLADKKIEDNNEIANAADNYTAIRTPLTQKKTESFNSGTPKDNKRDINSWRACAFCFDQHYASQCEKYKSCHDRRNRLQELNKCFICLSNRHISKFCPNKEKISCFYCKGEHNSSICLKQFGKDNRQKEPATGSMLVSTESSNCFLLTADGEIFNESKTKGCNVRILFDNACSTTSLKLEVAENISLNLKEKDNISVGIFGSANAVQKQMPKTKIFLKLIDGSFLEMNVRVVEEIVCPLQTSHLNAQRFPILQTICLADKKILQKGPSITTISLLIGADYFYSLVQPNRMDLDEGLAICQSKIGWLVGGKLTTTHQEESPDFSSVSLLCIDASKSPDFKTCEELKTFWELEHIGVKDNPIISDDDWALKQFNDNVEQINGRYQTTWPWKRDRHELPENYDLALKRLKSVHHSLCEKPSLLQSYDDVIQTWIKRDIIEEVNENKTEGEIKHYLPHHGVLRPGNTTTPIRVVHDASVKLSKFLPSLNDCLLKGPTLIESSCGILIRARFYPILLISDIEKAYLQIGLKPEERDVTRFLWLKDCLQPVTSDNLVIYRFCRVPFGIVSSAFLLSACIKHHLKKENTSLSHEIEINSYVDNVIVGKESLAEANKYYEEAKRIFNDASMNLREWNSNSKEFLQNIPENDRVETTIVKVLGVIWNTVEDTIKLAKPKQVEDIIKTRRDLAKSVASLYDPLGLFSPSILPAKVLLQSAWNQTSKWDDKLNQDTCKEWESLSKDLTKISEVALPRYVLSGVKMKEDKLELHVFTDASAKSYAAVAYLRCKSSKQIMCNIIMCKSRLAPVKKLSMPRLELLGILIGARLLVFVENVCNMKISKKVLWTDSKCVLSWINTSKLLSTFVQNRINEIKSVPNVEFRFVSTENNPADIPTRGMSVNDLAQCDKWWKGPFYLSMDESCWPIYSLDFSLEEDAITETEYRKNQTNMVLINPRSEPSSLESIIDPQKFSNLTRLLRVTAWMLRFIDKIRRKVSEHGPLNSIEINRSRIHWIKTIQSKHYADVIECIKSQKEHTLIKQFGLQLDDNGIIYCTGRLTQAEMTEGAKHPKLLPKLDIVTDLIVNDIHNRNLHVGVSQTLALIRLEFWIPHGRSKVKSILTKCRVCLKYENRPYKMPPMPPLPSNRVNASPPFKHTGFDYFGPLYVKNNGNSVKVWVCLFTCLVIRAIHLEVVKDMSADQFLLCVRRFVAKWGKPDIMISDNARQFKVVKSFLNMCWPVLRGNETQSDENVSSYFANNGIKFEFITEMAPWMGGYYERMIGLVKNVLRKTIGKDCLDYDQLETILVEIQAVINTRPLTYVSSDLNSSMPLSPAHFLSLNPKTGMPMTSVNEETYKTSSRSKLCLLTSWKKGNELLNCFWRLWRMDYLASLRERSQIDLKGPRLHSNLHPKEGEVVLIGDTLPRGTWKMGRIDKILESKDGNIRSAIVRLPTGNNVRRPISLLYPLECDI